VTVNISRRTLPHGVVWLVGWLVNRYAIPSVPPTKILHNFFPMSATRLAHSNIHFISLLIEV